MKAHSHLGQFYQTEFGLLTDLYQLTMARGYWQQQMHQQTAVFHLFFRRNPFGHPYTICAGLALAIDYLQRLRFSTADIQYLGSLRAANGKALFDESFLHHLQRLRFSCDVDAIPEGTCVFPHQPLIRVKGPLLQAQLIETALLNMVNFSSLIATKAARISQAAGTDTVLEFGLRRAQGIDGGLTASRSAYIGGCDASSNVLAGRFYGIPVKGTHAHSWVMCFDEEIEAFRAYAAALPHNCIFLVDTYDTIQGVKNAITVGLELRAAGHELLGIRLDSGDLADLSQQARQMLDEAGFPNADIVASDRLDENRIRELKARGATIAVWGVGTHLATAKDQPALGGVYKLAAIQQGDNWEGRIKRSEEKIKTSYPGYLQVRRYHNAAGRPVRDVMYSEWNPPTEQTDLDHIHLLQPVFKTGELVYHPPDVRQIRAYCLEQQEWFASQPHYPHQVSASLDQAREQLIALYAESASQTIPSSQNRS